MIGRLRGVLAEKLPGEVLLDVGGVGYQALISLQTFYALPPQGERVELFVVTNLRENALELFAFAAREEKAAFNLLRGVTGIGPRLALALLSGIAPAELAKAVAASDFVRLVAIPGIGRKTAERLVVELRGKLAPETDSPRRPGEGGIDEDAVSALLGLGYKRSEAEKAVRGARSAGEATLENLIRRALTAMAAPGAAAKG
ncbi:MAG: Holliday junction branch migration protein RuvA [Deltaproteobacteria bacterium]|nr:Holliday junction branch migration protein RuvA [Deltaproteobacteria bacterium]